MIVEWVWPLLNKPHIGLPSQWIGWLGWIFLGAAFLWGVMHTWHSALGVLNRRWHVLLALVMLVPLAFVVGLRLGGKAMQPLPYLPGEWPAPMLIPLLSVPWVLAAGLLGPFWASWIALLCGFLLSAFVTHDLFSPVLVGGLGLLYSLAVTQNYRGRFMRWLRIPWMGAVVGGLVYIPIYVVGAFFAVSGDLAARLDFALTQSWATGLARFVELVMAGLVASLVTAWPKSGWVRPSVLMPAPWETSLARRVLFVVLPLLTLLVLVMAVSHWVVAGNLAREMLRARLDSAAQVAAEGLPYFLESGQGLITKIADPALFERPPEAIRDYLAEQIRAIPYFRQLVLYDAQKHIVAAYPDISSLPMTLTDQENQALDLALKGIPVQTYTVMPAAEDNSVQVSFIASVGSTESPGGALVGRTDFESNPFTQPALAALGSVLSEGGDGFILDETRQVMFQANPKAGSMLGKPYGGRLPESLPAFFEDVSPLGTRQFVFARAAVGRPWLVILTVPVQRAQAMALEIAGPTLITIAVFALLVALLTQLGLRTLVESLRLLSAQAGQIAQGQLNSPVDISGVDEVGRLGHAFEQMRISLKARLEELDKLLRVSHAVAANLDIQEAILPVLDAARGDHASAARVVLIPDVLFDAPEKDLAAFGRGPMADHFAYLDRPLFELLRTQDILTVANVARSRRFEELIRGQPYPAALIALPLYYEDLYYGILWLGYDHRTFQEEELRFLRTLAGNAAMAAANARLYATAEVGRRRLEAVLTSVPEPVLVFDEKDRLILLNPAALQVRGLVSQPLPGKPLTEIVLLPELLELLSLPGGTHIQSREITLPNGRVYYASVATVMGEERSLGKVCVLQDITHYKELDTLKSDFVATVSHDLRSPLTLIRGYASMMQMVGDLNEQQKAYLQKIAGAIESMTRLVNNLLDLGRIEAGVGLRLEAVNPREIVQQVINQVLPQATQKSLDLRSDFDLPEDLRLQADPDLLKQALLNLVDNAVKYSRLHGEVVVRAEQQGERVVFSVRDDGIGIAPLDLPRLFEKFYRSRQREAHEQRGSGLGLAIVKSIVERHHGRVWVESQLGKGSVFYMELPLNPDLG